MTWNTVSVLCMSQLGSSEWEIQNVFAVFQVGSLLVHCPFPCDVLAVFLVGTPLLAPSERWDQARERRYQTIRALRLLMEVHDRSNQLLNSLPTRSAPSSQGDDTLIAGRLFLTAEEVPPLVTDEDDGLTDRDAEGSMDDGED